jgi:predicted dehydrogenase
MIEANEPLRLGILGCGDVTSNIYLPALRRTSALGQIAAVCDIREHVAHEVVSACSAWSPGAVAYADRRAFLHHPDLDAVLQLLPAPVHGEANAEVLQAGLHLYSEKPLASSLEEADELIALAEAGGKQFLCAPGVMASPVIRWIDKIIRSGRLGAPTVALATYGTLGGAAWRRYTGDPTVFYSEDVGPVLDLGVYLVHALTGLFGPVRRVQAMGSITIPERISLARGAPGKRIEVVSDDVVLAQLEFAQGGLAQLLASFATPATVLPQLEIHLAGGTISLSSLVVAETVDVFSVDPSPLGLEGWMRGLVPPGVVSGVNVIGYGAQHFVRVLAGGEEPALTAAHARHALEVMQTMRTAAREGGAFTLASSFPGFPEPADSSA